jgi:hypothetical protein
MTAAKGSLVASLSLPVRPRGPLELGSRNATRSLIRENDNTAASGPAHQCRRRR